MKTGALAILLALSVSACSTAAPTAPPNMVAEVQANPDLRIDPSQLWIDWAPDGERLVYVGSSRRLMLLDLANPDHPSQVSAKGGYAPRFRPDGEAIAFTGVRTQDGRTVNTLYLQRLDGSAPIDLLPGNLAIQSVSTAKQIHRWLDQSTLSYEEHMGTGVQQLFLLPISEGRLITDRELLATIFRWSPDGRRVAGHWTCCPSRFWVWDRAARKFVLPVGPQPGPNRWFEAWSDDGQQALFTEWQGDRPYQWQVRATLFRLNVATSQREILAENGILAAWSGNLVAYVKVDDRMTLVVADARDGRTIWMEGLGRLPDRFDGLHWDYRPVFAGPYLFFRAGDGKWRVSTAESKQVRTVYPEGDVAVVWSPDGRYGAILDRTSRLRVTETLC